MMLWASSGATRETLSIAITGTGKPGMGVRASRMAGIGAVLIAASQSMRAASRAPCPAATPSRAAIAFAWLTTPRAKESSPSPMRQVRCAKVAAAMPSASSQARPPMPAASRPTPASLKIAARTPACAAQQAA